MFFRFPRETPLYLFHGDISVVSEASFGVSDVAHEFVYPKEIRILLL